MLELFIFIFGLVVGSFLNVVIYRLPKRESIVFPPSHCPHCRHKLVWYDLIPVVSYVLLFGECRYCNKTISPIYPLVELLTGLLFVCLYSSFMSMGIVVLIYYFLILPIFLTIFFTDLKYGIIPFQLVLAGSIITSVYLVYTFSPYVLLSHLLSAFSAFLAFLFLFLITKGRGMGFGDVVLVFLMGLFLGSPYIAFALYIAFLTGAVTSLILILIGSKRLRHDTIPFGPFLVIGTFISLFYGEYILMTVRYFLPI